MTVPRGLSSGRQQLRGPILQEDVVRVIAQSLPEIGPVKPEVSRALASDTEYRLREVIRQAKSYMRHAKRSHLTVEDVANAYKRRDSQPVLGYGCGAESVEYMHVEGTSGLFIPKDSIVKLTDVVSAELPSRKSAPYLEPTWLVVGGKYQLAREGRATPGNTEVDRNPDKHFDSLSNTVMSALGETVDEAQVELALKVVAEVETVQPVLADFVRFIRNKVHENARASGCTDILVNATRLLHALFCRERFGVEAYYDHLLPALLTCLLGRKLGTGDHWGLRDLAASVLEATFQIHNEPLSRGRTAKTLVSVLTDQHAPLESVYGAIRGLAALGEDLFQSQVVPHVPALLRGLEAAASACSKLDEALKELVEEKIGRLCQLLDDVATETRTEEGELKSLLEMSV